MNYRTIARLDKDKRKDLLSKDQAAAAIVTERQSVSIEENCFSSLQGAVELPPKLESGRAYGPCRISRLKPSKRNGYVQAQVGKGPKTPALHKLAYLALNGRPVKQQGSHLCAKPRCINGRHILDESAADNNGRKNCPIWTRSFNFAEDGVILWLCEHEVPCIGKKLPKGTKRIIKWSTQN